MFYVLCFRVNKTRVDQQGVRTEHEYFLTNLYVSFNDATSYKNGTLNKLIFITLRVTIVSLY